MLLVALTESVWWGKRRVLFTQLGVLGYRLVWRGISEKMRRYEYSSGVDYVCLEGNMGVRRVWRYGRCDGWGDAITCRPGKAKS